MPQLLDGKGGLLRACPRIITAQGPVNCLRENCALWDETGNACADLSTTRRVFALNDTLGNILHELRKGNHEEKTG
jgi:hypothetical protein